MATLQKFKLLATQCAVAGSPARSPTTSPVVHLRRRKTLRMFLNRSSATPERRRFSRREDDHDSVSVKSPESKANKKEVKSRRKLKELFVSSPPLDEGESDGRLDDGVDLLPMTRRGVEGLAARRGGGGSDRPITSTFRYRLLMRRAWRPILVTISE